MRNLANASVLALTLLFFGCATQPARDFCEFVYGNPTCPSHGE